MDDKVAPPIGCFMNSFLSDKDTAKMCAKITTSELIMIPWYIDNLAALASLAEQLLNDVIV